MIEKNNIPKLLSPAGSYDALCAAISAGADEVYFGASSFNARQGAKNFDEDEFAKAIKLCRVCGVSSNITINTLLHDREINDVLNLIYSAASLGADAFIVQDMALSLAVKKSMPQVVLHASTQCACHNRDGAMRLFDAGFERIVLARELSGEDIKTITENAPYETESFVHGALCVSHSGQCLFSSVVGGRSGNRGMCAQPCRMEYTISSENSSKKGYPLSLKDLSLAQHIKELCDTGVSSLKIEGRMKSPEYVYGVTKIFKTLLSEKRNATYDEMSALDSLFSRSGFTDAYHTKKFIISNSDMYGIRSEKQKETTRILEKETVIEKPTRKISAVCDFSVGKVPFLSLIYKDFCVTANGTSPIEKAKSSGASFESVAKNLVKFGNTNFSLSYDDISMDLSPDAFVPASVVNELRRSAAEKLYEKLTEKVNIKRLDFPFSPKRLSECEKNVQVRLYFSQTDGFDKKIKNYTNIESVVFPLYAFEKEGEKIKALCKNYKLGVLFPRVMTVCEKDGAKKALLYAKDCGASFCEVSNIGHFDVVKDAGLEIYGGVGLNITNSLSAKYYAEKIGLKSLVLSPELKLAAVRDIEKSDDVKYCFYAKGRLPLMVLESCIVKASHLCKKERDGVCAYLGDRIGASFPIKAQKRYDTDFPCRNIIYNSVVSDILSKKELYLCGIDILCISAEENGISL